MAGWQICRRDLTFRAWITFCRLRSGSEFRSRLFFWLSDLGPALVIGCLFLTMYSIARKRVLLSLAGLAVIILAFAIGYVTGYPHTVRERVEMWKSPWDNHVRGGDQLADSLWSLSTGGATGTGLGLGDPQTMPAAHTDLVVSAFGEEAGVLGIVALYALYGVLDLPQLADCVERAGHLLFFPGDRARADYGVAVAADHRRPARTDSAFGRRVAVSELRKNVDGREFRSVCDRSFDFESRAKERDQQSEFRFRNAGTDGGAWRCSLLLVLARFTWVQVARADNILVRPSW